MRTKITFLLAITAFIACNNTDKNEEKKEIKAVHWLIGDWETKTNFGILSENWKKLNDSTFQGKSFFIKVKDTIHKESIILQQEGDTFAYSTTIKGQNNDKPIRFAQTSENENELIFENTTNDYPQKISYKKVSNDSIITEISGIQLGKPSTEKYTLVKTK